MTTSGDYPNHASKEGEEGSVQEEEEGIQGKEEQAFVPRKVSSIPVRASLIFCSEYSRITSQSDARSAFKTRKESLAVQNAELDAVLARVLEERNRIVRLFRQQSEGIATEIHETETATTMSIRGAIQEKHAFQQELQQEVDSLKAHLQEMKDEFAETTVSIDFYTNYRTNEHDQLAHQISSLKRAIEGEEKSFENEKIEIRERFERSKQLLLGITEKKLQDTKRRATDFALDRQGVKDKVACHTLILILCLSSRLGFISHSKDGLERSFMATSGAPPPFDGIRAPSISVRVFGGEQRPSASSDVSRELRSPTSVVGKRSKLQGAR